MVFSADHMNDPEKIKVLHSDGVLNDWRKDQLLNFPWHRDIILHEAGIPPIHTPMTFLSTLNEDIKKRLYIVHVGANSFKDEYGLKPAPVGVENTLTLEVEKSENAAALEVLDLVTGIDLFSSLSIEHAREILQIVETVEFKAGDYVIKKGDEGHTMMIIASGKADVRVKVMTREDRLNDERLIDKKGQYSPRFSDGINKSNSMISTAQSTISQMSIAEAAEEDEEEGEEEDADITTTIEVEPGSRSDLNGKQEESEKTHDTVKTFTTGDYFGEQALVAPDCIRSADIVARTDMVCYQFQRQDFNWLLHGTDVVAKIERMIMARQDAVWDLIGMNSVLRLLTPTQKTQLEQRCMPRYYETDEYVWEEGNEATVACLIDSGMFKFVKKPVPGRRRAPSVFRHLGPPPPPSFEPGCFVGEVDAFLEDKPLQTTLQAKEGGQVMLISKKDLLEVRRSEERSDELATTILTRRISGAWTSVQDAPPSSITEIILAIILTLFAIHFAHRSSTPTHRGCYSPCSTHSSCWNTGTLGLGITIKRDNRIGCKGLERSDSSISSFSLEDKNPDCKDTKSLAFYYHIASSPCISRTLKTGPLPPPTPLPSFSPLPLISVVCIFSVFPSPLSYCVTIAALNHTPIALSTASFSTSVNPPLTSYPSLKVSLRWLMQNGVKSL